MKKFIINFLIIFLIIFSVTEISYAQEQSSNNNIIVFVQGTLRNSDGYLITYLESSKITYFDLQALEQFFKVQVSNENAQMVSVDGKNYQILQITRMIEYEHKTAPFSTIFNDDTDLDVKTLVGFLHDGYFVAPGDKLELVWTFIREVN